MPNIFFKMSVKRVNMSFDNILLFTDLDGTLLNKKTFGPIEFFMNVMVLEMIAPEYGKHTLKEHFEKL